MVFSPSAASTRLLGGVGVVALFLISSLSVAHAFGGFGVVLAPTSATPRSFIATGTRTARTAASTRLALAASTIKQEEEEVATTDGAPEASKVVPIILLSGFLGSGKTTALKHLLENVDGAKIGVIVNDVAAVNIDSKLVSAETDGVVQLQNGCACCSLADELLTSVETILDSGKSKNGDGDDEGEAFDAVVVELSGVADPVAIKSNWKSALASGTNPVAKRSAIERVVTVVDACTFGTDWMTWDSAGHRKGWVDPFDTGAAYRKVPELLAEQVECADLILVNKADLAGEEQVEVAASLARGLNGEAVLRRVEFGRIETSAILGDEGDAAAAAAASIAEQLEEEEVVEEEGLGHAHGHDHDCAEKDCDDASHAHSHDHVDASAATITTEDCTAPDCTDSSHSHSHNTHDDDDADAAAADCSAPGCTDTSHSHSHDHNEEASDCAAPGCTDTSHSHSHDHSSSDADADAACADSECTDPTHDHSHNHDHASTAAANLGISNFVYKASIPFNKDRLLALLGTWPIPIKDMLDVGLVTDAKSAEYEATAETDSGDDDDEAGTSPFLGVLRSKGFCWFAPEKWTGTNEQGADPYRHDAAMYWSHAGKHFGINGAGQFWGALPKEVMREAFASNLAEFDRITTEDFVTDEFGDRRQELVFIGAGGSMDETNIRSSLDACLLSEDEMVTYRTEMVGYEERKAKALAEATAEAADADEAASEEGVEASA